MWSIGLNDMCLISEMLIESAICHRQSLERSESFEEIVLAVKYRNPEDALPDNFPSPLRVFKHVSDGSTTGKHLGSLSRQGASED